MAYTLMDTQSRSRRVFCCGAKVWTLLIGWMQMIGGGVALISSIILVSDSISAHNKIHSWPQFRGVEIAAIVFLFVSLLITVISGIYLLIGLCNKNITLLKVWLVLQWILFFLLLLGTLISIFDTHVAGFFIFASCVFVHTFILWVVDIHRRELMEEIHTDHDRSQLMLSTTFV